jgi:hypothetical protein
MLKLGHIVYSNCFPVRGDRHRREISLHPRRGRAHGTQRKLADGVIDVAVLPIEYAVNQESTCS